MMTTTRTMGGVLPELKAGGALDFPPSDDCTLVDLPYANDMTQGSPFTEREAEQFVTRVVPGMAEGHEVLTRMAARGLPGVPVSALVAGVRRVDTGGSLLNTPGALLSSMNPTEQKRHALRRSLCQSTRAALTDIRGHLARLHRQALASASNRNRAFEWIGEALHLIQDSYSAAHTQRAFGRGPGGTHPVQYVRFFGLIRRLPPVRTQAPNEHNFPTDSRDQIRSRGGLTREASASAVASREFLMMMLRHLRTPVAATNPGELRRFMVRHLSPAARTLEPGYFHPRFCAAPRRTPPPSPGTPGRPVTQLPEVFVCSPPPNQVLDRFPFARAILTARHVAMIRTIAGRVAAAERTGAPIRTIVLAGNTDDRGPDELNIRLGRARAEAVRARFAAEIDRLLPGLSARLRFQVSSAGESDPVASNATDDGRAKNRRVDVCLVPQSATPPQGGSGVRGCIEDCVRDGRRRFDRPLTRVEEVRLRRRCERRCRSGVPV